jgi:hypothetical protein
VKKRGLPEGYVRGLEKLWGLAVRDVDDIETNMLGVLAGGEDGGRLKACRFNQGYFTILEQCPIGAFGIPTYYIMDQC